MRQAIPVLAAALLASALLASQAEAAGRDGFERMGVGRPFGRQELNHFESYPSYVPNESCPSLESMRCWDGTGNYGAVDDDIRLPPSANGG